MGFIRDYVYDELEETFYPYLRYQASLSACGKFVVEEGRMVGMKEEAMICQQAR